MWITCWTSPSTGSSRRFITASTACVHPTRSSWVQKWHIPGRGWVEDPKITSVADQDFHHSDCSRVPNNTNILQLITLLSGVRATQCQRHTATQWLTEFREHMTHMPKPVKGFKPRQTLFQMLRPEEVEMLVCGNPDFDMDALKKVTVYDGYSSRDATIRWEDWAENLRTKTILQLCEKGEKALGMRLTSLHDLTWHFVHAAGISGTSCSPCRSTSRRSCCCLSLAATACLSGEWARWSSRSCAWTSSRVPGCKLIEIFVWRWGYIPPPPSLASSSNLDRTGCWNVSHSHQSSWLRSPGRSQPNSFPGISRIFPTDTRVLASPTLLGIVVSRIFLTGTESSRVHRSGYCRITNIPDRHPSRRESTLLYIVVSRIFPTGIQVLASPPLRVLSYHQYSRRAPSRRESTVPGIVVSRIFPTDIRVVASPPFCILSYHEYSRRASKSSQVHLCGYCRITNIPDGHPSCREPFRILSCHVRNTCFVSQVAHGAHVLQSALSAALQEQETPQREAHHRRVQRRGVWNRVVAFSRLREERVAVLLRTSSLGLGGWRGVKG